MASSWWIAGTPSPFANGLSETAWKQRLRSTLPAGGAHAGARGLQVQFNLDSRGKPKDLDNLLDPVLTVLVGTHRWFEGSRPSIQAVAASKDVRDPTGARVSICAVPLPVIDTAVEPFVDAVYTGPFPKAATDPVIADWIRDHGAKRIRDGSVSVNLAFGGPTNIGEITTGPVKSIIDGLWPLLGGTPGRPQDARIRALGLQRDVVGVDDNAVHITVGRPVLWPSPSTR